MEELTRTHEHPANGKDPGKFSDIMGLVDILGTTVAQRVHEDLARMMLTGSNKPMEALPRTILTMKELKLKERIALRKNTFLFGASKYDEKETYDLIGRPAVDGLARKQAIHIATHTPMLRRQGPMGQTAQFDNGPQQGGNPQQ